MTKRALMLIDLQNDYYPDGKWPVHNIEAATQNAVQILENARKSGDTVVHIYHEFPTKEAPFFVPNSEGAKIHKSVAPMDDEPVILKHKANSFCDTNLKAVLDQNGVEDVTIIGAMSHMCIDASSRAAADFGYNVTVIEDACGAKDLTLNDKTVPAEDVHTAFMAALGFAYAQISDTETYLADKA